MRGTLLGYQGSTGGSTGSHLHFQIDKDFDLPHPFWVTTNVNSTADAENVKKYNFNPMRLVKAHGVNIGFNGLGACVGYFTGLPGIINCEQFERTIDHEWFIGSPSGFGPDFFSARWEGTISLPPAKGWIFYSTVDDGARLWIDNNLVVDQWNSRTENYPQTFASFVQLNPGNHFIRFDYFETYQNATVKLAWQQAFYDFLPIIIKMPTPTATLTPTPTQTPTPTRTPTPNLPYNHCEPNESISSACSIGAGYTYSFMYPSGDNDWFRYNANVPAGQARRLKVWLQSIPAGNNYDIELYDPGGLLLGSSRNVGSVDEYIDKRIEISGTYKIHIYSASGYSQNDSYQIRVDSSTVEPLSPPYLPPIDE